MVLMRREAQLQGVNTVKVWVCNSGCYDPSFYQQGGATVNGTYALLLKLPYLSDYQANPTLDKLVTQLGGVNNMNNNALGSYNHGPAVPGRGAEGDGQRRDAESPDAVHRAQQRARVHRPRHHRLD